MPCIRLTEDGRMTAQNSDVEWQLSQGGTSLVLRWRMIGTAGCSDGTARFPAAPARPGVYLVRVAPVACVPAPAHNSVSSAASIVAANG